MKTSYVVIAMSVTLGLAGCGTTRDLTQMESNVNTASEGDFGKCMQAMHAGAVNLEKARKILDKGRRNDDKLTKSKYEKGMRVSEEAVLERQMAEEACEARVAAVEERVQAIEQRVQRTKEVLRGVTFVEGSARLTPEAKATLRVVANRLMRQPTMVEVQGHTSNTGTLEFNMKLSEQRANAVRAYLIEQGVSADRITARGYGPTQPIASNDTAEGRRVNQRVELVFSEEIE